MIDLPSVTLLCADCVDENRAEKIIKRCTDVCNCGAVKFLTSLYTNSKYRVGIDHLASLVEYSIFMLKRADTFVDTEHVLVVQHDGYIINADAWNPEWLKYDYIGPLFIQDHKPGDMVGSGGFSLRSKRLMEFVRLRTPTWDGSLDSTARVQKALGNYEDGVICHAFKYLLTAAGFKIAPPEVAAKFAQGGYPHRNNKDPNDRTYYVERPFGFHGGWSNVNRETGVVSPPPFA